MLTPREETLYQKISPEEDRTRDTVDSEPKHYQRAIPAPNHDANSGSGDDVHSNNENGADGRGDKTSRKIKVMKIMIITMITDQQSLKLLMRKKEEISTAAQGHAHLENFESRD